MITVEIILNMIFDFLLGNGLIIATPTGLPIFFSCELRYFTPL